MCYIPITVDYNQNLSESLNENGRNDVTMTIPMSMPNERDTDPHKLQLMKSSFFAIEEMEYTTSKYNLYINLLKIIWN